MTRTTTKPVDTVAWIAVSWYGYPAPLCGWAFTKKALVEAYVKMFPADADDHGVAAFKRSGYRAVKVRIRAVRGARG